MAREAAFPEPEFERERRQKLEEVKLDRTQPGFLASERLRKVLFGAHPYATAAPTEAQVAAYKRSDLTQIYREFYTPENALLVMVGDFDTATMLKSIEKAFDGVDRQQAHRQCRSRASPTQGAPRVPRTRSRSGANANPRRLSRDHAQTRGLGQAGTHQ